MKKTTLKWILLFGIHALFSLSAHSETVQEAQIQLLQLEKQSLAKTAQLADLETEKTQLEVDINDLRTELAEKEEELEATTNAMEKAIAKHYAEPTPESEQEADLLTRSFTLAESAVRRRQLKLDRYERKFEELIESEQQISGEQEQINNNIEAQKRRIAQLRADAAVAAERARAAAERKAQQAAKPEPAPQKPEPEAEPQPETVAAKEPEPAPVPEPKKEEPKKPEK